MFLNNLTTLNKEKVRDAVLVELDNFGLRNDLPKKTTKHIRRLDGVGNVFRTPLDRLPMTTVRLQSGVDVQVPTFITEACQFIIKNVDVEGIFRKTGSAARQREIKMLLDAGRLVSLGDHHVIDVASVLKLFFRELPESLVPAHWHDAFVRCLALGVNASPAILLLCLLLPPSHLATLSFLMQILQQVASHSDKNKMDQSNLAIILAPTVMPVQIPGRMEKAPAATVRLNNHVQIIQILIIHAQYIGMVPEYVSGPIEPSSSSSSLINGERPSLRRSLTRTFKKKHRRSASLTRMLNGLRKIVGARGSPDGSSSEEETPASSQILDFSTPCLKPCKKRKAHDMSTSGLSTKKKREVLQLLPQSCPLADTPFTPARPCASRTLSTPAVSIDPSPTREEKSSPKQTKKRFFRARTTSESEKCSKRSLLSMGGKVTKKPKRSDGGKEYHGFLERSWSAVSNTSNWGRRKLSRLSLLSTSTANTDSETLVDEDGDVGVDLSLSQNALTPMTASPPVVCLSARQYADIERRVSDMETRITTEMNQVREAAAAAAAESPEPLRAADTVQAVETVYQRTLEGSERLLDSSADQLARQLGQQLKIRRRSEARVMRSPSARKIGSIRKELRRNKSWHTFQNVGNGSHLRRGKPNTVASGLPQHAPNRVLRPLSSTLATSSPRCSTPNPNRAGLPSAGAPPKRASSFHVHETANSAGAAAAKKYSSQINIAKRTMTANSSADEKWYDAVEQMSRLRPRLSPAYAQASHRDSIARLRCENAGMVLAKARLFGAATAPPRPRGPNLQLKPPEPRKEVKAVAVLTQTDSSSSSPRKSDAAVRNLRPRPTPPVAAVGNEPRRVKKHNSLRIDRAELSHPVRRNLSTPSHWPDKENRVGKASPKQIAASPLRDSNRVLPSTPAPAIKPSLGARVQRRAIATPRSVKGRPTPLRALATPTGINSPRHRSPRVAMGARALVARSRQ